MAAINIITRGPLFRLGAGPVRKAIKDSIEELVGLGEREVKLQLYSGHGVLTGHYRRSIHGDVLSSKHGIVHDSKVVYGPWLEGTSSRNKTTRFKGYAMFRLARQKLQRIKGGVVKRQVAKAVRRLGG